MIDTETAVDRLNHKRGQCQRNLKLAPILWTIHKLVFGNL